MLFRRKIPDTVRQVRLRRSYAADFPFLKPGRWHVAADVAGEILRRRNGADEGDERALDEGDERALDENCFEFRGGMQRNPAWPVLRTRVSDREASGAL
jgi:hypothetical protein